MRVIRGSTPVAWRAVGEPKILASRQGLELGVQSFRNPRTGEVIENSFFTKNEGVTVCTITVDGNLLLVRQFKQAAKDIVLEFPAGLIKPGESAVAAATREIREETGFESGKVFQTSPTNKILYAPRKSPSGIKTCIALNCKDIGTQSLDKSEDAIQVLEATFKEVWDLLRNGEIRSVESREAVFNAILLGYLSPP